MTMRRLGESGLMVGPLAFGGNVFGWTVDDSTAFELLDAFLAAGMNLIDTANVYARWAPGNQGGESERTIGRWMKERGVRDRVILATKVGMEMGADRKGLSRAAILREVEESLARLRTDRIDLYQAHTDDEATPLEETLETFSELVKQGKVRVIGASNYGAKRLAAALDTSRARSLPRYESLQPRYNLLDRAGFEGELRPLCRSRNVGVIPYPALASGFLTGKYRSAADAGRSARGGRATQYLDERGRRILAALDDAAREHGAPHAAVAIAWLLAKPGVTAPIASATTTAQLEELLAGTRLTLAPETIRRLDEAGA